MRKVFLVFGIVMVAAVLAATVSARNGGVQFIDPGTDGDTGPFGTGMTADGSTFAASQGAGAANCVVWNELTGWTYLADTQGTCYMSHDGTQFGSTLDDAEGVSHMARWYPDTGFLPVNELPELAPCDFFQSDTFGISGDGETLVGLGWAGCTSARAITSTNDCIDDEGSDESDDSDWGYADMAGNDDDEDGECVPGGVMTRYESWGSDRSNRMNGANYDGSLLLGWQDTEFGSRYGARWDDGAAIGTWFCDPDDPVHLFCGEAYDSNSPGTAVAGLNYTSEATEFISEGWVWHEETGIQGTGHFPGAFFLDRGANFAVSEDGTTVGGRFGFGPFSSATLWTEATGQINLNQFLIDQGLTEPFDGWFLVQVNDIVGHSEYDSDDEGDDCVEICHKPGTPAEKNKCVPYSAVDGHLGHGDELGECNDTDDRFRLLIWAANPDAFLGNQTIILDISTVAVCHDDEMDPGEPRTLYVSWGEAQEHVRHGDFLGTCEAAGGGFSRAAGHAEHFGVDPNNECFQRSVQDFTNNNAANAQLTPELAERMFSAAANCSTKSKSVTPGATQKSAAPREVGRRAR